MGPVSKTRNAFARVAATFVAGLLLLQVALAGAAVAAVDDGQGAAFGVVCATANPPARPTDGQPATPQSAHRHGLCCILHGAAIAPPPVNSTIAIVLPDIPEKTLATSSVVSAPAFRAAPKGAPQSPRAPPL